MNLPTHLNRAERRAIQQGRAFSDNREFHQLHYNDWNYGCPNPPDEIPMYRPRVTNLKPGLRYFDDFGELAPAFLEAMYQHAWEPANDSTGPEAYELLYLGA